MKATIYNRSGKEICKIDREFKDFAEFQTLDLKTDITVILYGKATSAFDIRPYIDDKGDVDLEISLKGTPYMQITHYPEFGSFYGVLYSCEGSDTVCSLQPAGRKIEEITKETRIGFVKYEVMMDVVEHFFSTGHLKQTTPSESAPYWYCYLRDYLSDEEVSHMEQETERLSKEYERLKNQKGL